MWRSSLALGSARRQSIIAAQSNTLNFEQSCPALTVSSKWVFYLTRWHWVGERYQDAFHWLVFPSSTLSETHTDTRRLIYTFYVCATPHFFVHVSHVNPHDWWATSVVSDPVSFWSITLCYLKQMHQRWPSPFCKEEARSEQLLL